MSADLQLPAIRLDGIPMKDVTDLKQLVERLHVASRVDGQRGADRARTIVLYPWRKRMNDGITQTAHDDAPLSAAKHPDVSAATDDLDARRGDVLVGRSVTIDRPRADLYAFWRDFTHLPLFMHNVHSVVVEDALRSHWVIEAPAGQTVEWDAEISLDEPGRTIAWRSLEGASVRNSGRVEFLDSPDGRGTVVRVTLVYDPPAGAVGKLVAKLFQKEPKIQARQDLRRFKQLMETGEVSTAQAPDAAPRS